MLKTLTTLVALLALASPALAEGSVRIELDANGEHHTLELELGDDGSLTALLDGEPVALPGAGLPALPTLP